MHWFYQPEIKGKTFFLTESESKHCIRVLRLQIGQMVYVTNGKGTLLECKILDENPKKTVLEIVNEFLHYNKRDYSLHIAVAPTKTNERYEWFMEKATEIGIDVITPIITKNSERDKINFERYDKVIESAMKQSYKAYHPQLNELISFKDFVKKNTNVENKYIAHCLDSPKTNFADELKKGTDVIVLIGPEGGFDKSELELAILNGYKPVSLGNSRLRTETAAVMACATVAIKNQ